MSLDRPTALARALIRCPSVTPAEGALSLLEGTCAGRVHGAPGDLSEPGTPDVENPARDWKRRAEPLLRGHTDVVPPGDEARWTYPPFAAEIRDGALWP